MTYFDYKKDFLEGEGLVADFVSGEISAKQTKGAGFRRKRWILRSLVGRRGSRPLRTVLGVWVLALIELPPPAIANCA